MPLRPTVSVCKLINVTWIPLSTPSTVLTDTVFKGERLGLFKLAQMDSHTILQKSPGDSVVDKHNKRYCVKGIPFTTKFVKYLAAIDKSGSWMFHFHMQQP